MRWTLMILAAVSVFGSAAALSQAQGQLSTPEVPPTDTIAEGIPGVIRAGTKIEVVIASVPGHGDPGVTLQGTEGPIALPDGTLQSSMFRHTTRRFFLNRLPKMAIYAA